MESSDLIAILDDPASRARERSQFLGAAISVARRWDLVPRIYLMGSRPWKSLSSVGAVLAKERSREGQRFEIVSAGERQAFGECLQSELAFLEPELVIIGLSHRELARGALTDWKHRALRSCAAPVLVVPHLLSSGLRKGREPFDSFLVPMSGEQPTSASLDWAIRKGNSTGVPVDVWHVTNRSAACGCDPSAVGHVSDEFYHEYPRLVEEFLFEGSPYTSHMEKRVIRDFSHWAGDPVQLLPTSIPRGWGGLLVLEWKGRFERGRAMMVKRMLARGDVPVLLIKEAERSSSRLKVGEEFEAA